MLISINKILSVFSRNVIRAHKHRDSDARVSRGEREREWERAREKGKFNIPVARNNLPLPPGFEMPAKDSVVIAKRV